MMVLMGGPSSTWSGIGIGGNHMYVCPVKFTCNCKIFKKGRYSISTDGSGRDHGVQGQPMAYGTRPSRSARR